MKEMILRSLTTRNITIGISWGLYAILMYVMFVGYFVAVPPTWWTL